MDKQEKIVARSQARSLREENLTAATKLKRMRTKKKKMTLDFAIRK